MPEANGACDLVSRIVRPPMGQKIGHPPQQVAIRASSGIELKDAGYAAHAQYTVVLEGAVRLQRSAPDSRSLPRYQAPGRAEFTMGGRGEAKL